MTSGKSGGPPDRLELVAGVERAGLELAEVAEVERAGRGLAEVAGAGGWRPIPGLYCVGGPVAGCIFALSGGIFGAPGLVLVGFGDSARCVALVNSAGYVSLNVSMGPANSRPPGSSWPPRPGGDHVR